MDDNNMNNYDVNDSNDTNESGKSGAGAKAKVAAAVIGGIMLGIGGVKAAGKIVGKKAKSVKKKHSGKKAGELLDKAEQKRQEMLDALEEYDEYMKDHPELSEEESEEETDQETTKAEKPKSTKGSKKR